MKEKINFNKPENLDKIDYNLMSEIIDLLCEERVNDYSEWVNIGMALKNYYGNDRNAFELW